MFAGYYVSGNTNWNADIYKNVRRFPAMCKCLLKSELEKKGGYLVCVCGEKISGCLLLPLYES